MYPSLPYDLLASMIKSNPELESVIQAVTADQKKVTSTLVHELRNPLSLLKGTLQYIETKHPEVHDFKYWDQLPDLIDDMEKLMADATLLNNMNQLKKEETNLITLIDNLTNSFMPQALTTDIDLSFHYEPLEAQYFTSYFCDGGKLKQALINLLKNAFEATKAGSFIHINLQYLPMEQELPSKLSIQISNNGEPIPEDALENIFIPFVTYKKGGTGVGLALVKQVAELHYGHVSVESKVDLTSFTIQLPL